MLLCSSYPKKRRQVHAESIEHAVQLAKHVFKTMNYSNKSSGAIRIKVPTGFPITRFMSSAPGFLHKGSFLETN